MTFCVFLFSNRDEDLENVCSKNVPNTGLENGQELDDIEIDYRSSDLKPLHAKWLISFYSYVTATKSFLMDEKDQIFMIQLQ